MPTLSVTTVTIISTGPAGYQERVNENGRKTFNGQQAVLRRSLTP